MTNSKSSRLSNICTIVNNRTRYHYYHRYLGFQFSMGLTHGKFRTNESVRKPVFVQYCNWVLVELMTNPQAISSMRPPVSHFQYQDFFLLNVDHHSMLHLHPGFTLSASLFRAFSLAFCTLIFLMRS